MNAKWLKRGLCALFVLAVGFVRANDYCWECEESNVLEDVVDGITWHYQEVEGEAFIVDASPIKKSLVIPSRLGALTVCGVDDWAFENAVQLESVTIPDSVYYVSGMSFDGCSKLKTFVVDSGNENLKVENNMLMSRDGRTLFRASSALALLTIPEGVTVVDDGAFGGLTKLTTVNIGASVTNIGRFAFGGCSALKTITVHSENKFFTVENGLLIAESVYDNETVDEEAIVPAVVRACSDLVSVEIPDRISAIRSDAFSGIKKLKSVFIPEGVETIGESAFDGCTGLTSVTIPDSAGTIGESAFEDCTKLNTVVIGAAVELIEDSAFAGCRVLKKVVFKGNRPFFDYWDEDYDEDDEGYDDEKNYEHLFEDAPSSCVIFVQEDSDWREHCEIPGTWYGHKIRYSLQIECKGLEDGSFTTGVKGDADGIELALPADVKSVSIRGLPAGMKYDAKSKKIVGAPTKAGTFTATISVTTQDGTKDDKSITFTVDAISPMAVGTFKGFIVDGYWRKFGTLQFTTTAAGKLSAKVVTAAGTYSFSATAWDQVDDSTYNVKMETKKGECLEIKLESATALNKPSVFGSFRAGADSDRFSVWASYNLLGKTWYFAANDDCRERFWLRRFQRGGRRRHHRGVRAGCFRA